MAYYNGKKVISLIHFDGRTAKKTFSESVKGFFDLTNTTWLLNEELLNTTPQNRVMEQTTIQELKFSEGYQVNFETSNQLYIQITFYNVSRGQSPTTPRIRYYYVDEETGGDIMPKDIYNYITKTFTNNSYRRIKITGGEDATNPNLFKWLLKNATQIFD